MYNIIVHDPGLQSTIQDFGRWGYQSKGYSVGGAMDQFALKTANILVGNDPGEACIEMTLKGVEVTFPCRTVIAVTGADMQPILNGKPIEMWASYLVKPGDVLSLGIASVGLRTYLSVKGGFALKSFLGSKSTSLQEKTGSNEGKTLQKGSSIPVSCSNISDDYVPKKLKADLIPAYYYENCKEIRVIEGPFEDYFTQKGIQTFYESEYIVGNDINRVGYRLEGSPIEHKKEAGQMISLSMTTGSIQVPGGGLPIILCVERRTHGGYPVIATVASVDMSKIAQCRAGDKIRFVKISIEEAHRLLQERESLLHNESAMKTVNLVEVLMRLPDMVEDYYIQLYDEFF